METDPIVGSGELDKAQNGMEINLNGCIVCNGEIGDYECVKALTTEFELVIAVDGGANHLKTMGLFPNVVIGDMNSENRETECETRTLTS